MCGVSVGFLIGIVAVSSCSLGHRCDVRSSSSHAALQRGELRSRDDGAESLKNLGLW